MKKFNILTFLFFVSFALFSCSSDDDSNADGDDNGNNENVLTYGNSEYDVVSGIIFDFGEWQGAYNFDIVLLTTDVSVEDGELIFEDNIASHVYFELWTDNPNDLETGTYVYSESEEAGTFSYAEAAIEYNYEEGNEDAFKSIEEGTVEIIQNGPTYEIIFDCITINDVEVSGHYEGTLLYQNENEEDGSEDQMMASKKSLVLKKK